MMNDLKIVDARIVNYFEKIDGAMNSQFTIIDSKSRNYDEKIDSGKFDSGKLIHSLVSIGIPLSVGLKMLEVVTDKIRDEYENRTLETSTIREYVRKSLLGLAEVGVEQKQCLIWGDVYLRKYGNPKGPIDVIHRNGKFEKLDYEFLRDKIVLEIFVDILKTEKSKILKSISRKELVSMGNELMRVISELGIYRIHHRTLLLLAKEIAMQPPHPWVADPSELDRCVAEDLKKSITHLNKIQIHYDEGNLSNCRNSIREYIHHTSAAILNYYNEISGCGDLSAFYNLTNKVNAVLSVEKYPLPYESKILMIKEDVQFSNITLMDFSDLLKKLKNYMTIIDRDESINEMIPLLMKYQLICKNIVQSRLDLKGELEAVINTENLARKGVLFEDITKKILEQSKYFTVLHDVKSRKKQFDLVIEHNCKSDGFSDIKKHIYVECKNTKSKVGRDVVEKLGKRIEDISNRFCNTGIIVSANGFTTHAVDEAISYLDKGTLIILLQSSDLYAIIEGDIIKEFETKINLLFYGKLS